MVTQQSESAASTNLHVQQSKAQSAWLLWLGRIMSTVAIIFLLVDAVIKLIPLPIVGETLVALGYPASVARTIGVLTLVPVLFYAIPRTSFLGAVLLTGLLGGAMASHLRVGSPIFSHLLFGLYLGLLIWGGLYLRDGRLRAIFPYRKG